MPGSIVEGLRVEGSENELGGSIAPPCISPNRPSMSEPVVFVKRRWLKEFVAEVDTRR
jgi:hypothetical protein